MNKYRKRDKNLQKHEMSFTYEALVCLGKQTAFKFPLDWSYSLGSKRELQGNFTAILNKFLKHFKKITVMHGSILPVTIPPGQPRGQVQPFGPGGGELFEVVLSRGEGGGENRK